MKKIVEHLRRSSEAHGELSAVYSGLAVAAEKLQRPGMQRIFASLAGSEVTRNQSDPPEDLLGALGQTTETHLQETYSQVEEAARDAGSRGVLRAVTWARKVAAIHRSLINRYAKSGEELLKAGQEVRVCQACGFISLGTDAPALCPVCKAPAHRFVTVSEVE